MLRSLWSGVGGMQAHQIALDVESNNIANVNTNGFKYSRADFSTMIVQTQRGATVPYAGFGGVNDYSVGLGTGIETTTKVFSQGSLQNTHRKADLALTGNGMFVVSGNGGISHLYTRDGGFSFDAVGNLVTTSGYIVQGWLRDLGEIESSNSSGAGTVDSTRPTGNITIDPRLTIPAKATRNLTGAINLTSGVKTEHTTLPSSLDSTATNNYLAGGLDRIYDTKDRQLEVEQDMGVMFNDAGEAIRLQESQGIWVSYQTATSQPLKIDSAYVGSTTITINEVNITWTNNPQTSRSSNLLTAQVAINNQKDKTGVEALIRSGQLILQNTNQIDGDASKKNIRARITGGTAFADSSTIAVTTAFRYTYTQQTDADSASGNFRTTEDLRALLQQDANKVKQFGGDSAAAATAAANRTFVQSTFSVKVILNNSGQFAIENKQDGFNASANAIGIGTGLTQPAYDNLNIFVSAYNDTLTTTNVLFKNQMKALNTGVLVEGGNVTTSGGLRMAKFASTIAIYDSLGNKHNLTIDFTKVRDKEWSWKVTVPEPAELLGASAQRPNILEGGSVTFGDQGELLGFNPSTIQFKPNNGAAFPQNINLDFGTAGGHSGLTSTGSESAATNVNGDGYPSGQFKEFYFDKTGTMIGIFNNGRNLALAQVAIATFANYEGLQESGSNLYSESPNSGRATIGTAGTGGRAAVEASKLEMSNTDLSRGLTQLIVVQRGFQANSKSVTTADQILNTLLGLKQ
ncbi:flagellar hook protein FlgE [Helicobacter apodemus]|uniref:Flagellar hook protein FlgE n=1 Tax=Helicobacter apodemus TaxID=135569 RepID=A0A4U8UER7_9HELI|nr:flagellar hook protein FlgE [Helicobacter apodemus]TLE16223.1 flagellar hook protein FlgE [Helicobacter apodemus]